VAQPARRENTDNAFRFAPEPAERRTGGSAWKVLVVDDESEVHAVTELALRDVSFDGKPLSFLNAYSAAQAFGMIAEQSDIAVILLDVVMETPDAGLLLVNRIRSKLNNKLVRIIVRTGQPGLNPELQTLGAYEINDYRTKTELTAQQLQRSLTASLRNYLELTRIDEEHRAIEDKLMVSFSDGLKNFRNWIAIDSNRMALEKTITSGASWIEMPALEQFIDGVLSRTKVLLHESRQAISPQPPQSQPATGLSHQAVPQQAAPATVGEQSEDDKYDRTSRNEALSILRGMCESGSLITFHFNGGYEFLLTSLRAISPDGKSMIFEGGSNPQMYRKLLQASNIQCISSRERIKIRFQLPSVQPIQHDGRPGFAAEVPEFLLRLQRREHYRLPIPLANSVRAAVPVLRPDGALKKAPAVVFDLSLSGICLIVSPEEANLQIGDECTGAAISLPEIGALAFDFKVCNSIDITSSSGKILRRLGCEFVNPAAALTKAVQSYVLNSQQRGSLARK